MSVSKPALAIVGAAALAAAVFVFSAASRNTAEIAQSTDLSAQFDHRDLQAGDLVFRRGRDGIADAVMTYGNGSRYSHVGAVVIKDGAPRVIHAVPQEGEAPGGVLDESFSEFGAPHVAAALGVYRVTGLTEFQRQQIQGYLYTQIGKPFDLSLKASDDGEQYCTELVIRALRASKALPESPLRTVESGLMPEPVIPPEAILEISGVTRVPSEGG